VLLADLILSEFPSFKILPHLPKYFLHLPTPPFSCFSAILHPLTSNPCFPTLSVIPEDCYYYAYQILILYKTRLRSIARDSPSFGAPSTTSSVINAMKIIFYVNLVISVDEALSHCKSECRVEQIHRGAQKNGERLPILFLLL
jgi:hypothetical protein